MSFWGDLINGIKVLAKNSIRLTASQKFEFRGYE